MENISMGTTYIKDQLSRCEDVQELKEEIIPMILDQKNLWQKKINEIVSKSTLTKKSFAERCHVSRETLYKWLKQGAIPRDRETFIVVGLSAGYALPEMNKLLTRYGRYSELYSKTLDDCVAIYVINNVPAEIRTEKYYEILEKINALVLNKEDNIPDVRTEDVNEKLYEVRSIDSLERFIVENSNIFSQAYSKLFAAINMFISANYSENVERLSLGQGWSSSLKHTVYEIKRGTWRPNRNKIISLGIHLSMTHEEVDELLHLAHMEPLYSKNLFEGIIMFALDSAEVEGKLRPANYNEKDSENSENYFDPDDLIRYTLDIFHAFDDPEIKDFLNELEGINDE